MERNFVDRKNVKYGDDFICYFLCNIISILGIWKIDKKYSIFMKNMVGLSRTSFLIFYNI